MSHPTPPLHPLCLVHTAEPRRRPRASGPWPCGARSGWRVAPVLAWAIALAPGCRAEAVEAIAATAPRTLSLKWSTQLTVASASVAGATDGLPAATPDDPTPQGRPTPWSRLLDLATQSAGARAAQADADAAQARRDQAWGNAWLPKVDGTASLNRSWQVVNGNNLNTPTSNMGLSAAMPLWRASDRATARASDAQAAQANWQARQAQVALAQELSFSWLDAVETQELMRLAQRQLALLTEQVGQHDRRLAAGAGSVLELLETRTRLGQRQAEQEALSARLQTHRLNIERLTGHAVVLPSGLQHRRGAAWPQVTPPLNEALALAGGRNPLWQDALAETQAASALLEARDTERWQPTLDAVASMEYHRQQLQFNGLSEEQKGKSHTVGLQLSWPLFTGMQNGRSREAASGLVKAQAHHDDTQTRVLSELRDAYQRLERQQQQVLTQGHIEGHAQASRDAIAKALAAGLRSHLDLLDAQDRVHAAQREQASAMVATLRAQVQILALLDMLDAEHVAPLTALLDTRS